MTNVKEPHERTNLITPDNEDEAQSLLPARLQHNTTSEDDPEASICTSVTSAADAETKSTDGIAGVIAVLLLGVFIANADGSIVLATYGVISSDIGNLDDASWLVVTYTLAMCAVQPTYGKLSDIYGRKSLLIFSYCFFGIGCALCGAGQTTWQVVLGRAIAGIGGAGMTSLVSVLIADKVPLRDVATWRGYVNVAATIGRSAGGPFGGFLADTIGWRWSFYIQCPLALVSILLVAWKLSSPNTSENESAKSSVFEKLHRIDIMGSISLALTIVSFLIALDLGGQKLSWDHFFVWILFGLSAVFGLLFLLVEAYWAREPIFPLNLMIQRDVVTAYLATGFQMGAQFAMMFTVPLYFQITADASVTSAGFHLFPAVFGNALGGLVSGFIIKRTASYKSLTIAATLISSMAYALLLLFWHGETNLWESLYITPGGFGTGIVLATTFVALAAGTDDSKMAIASTGLYLSANIGSLVGASLASTVLQTSLRKALKEDLKGIADRDTIIRRALSELRYVQLLEGKVREIVVDSYVHSFGLTHGLSLACAAVAFLVSLCMREHDLG